MKINRILIVVAILLCIALPANAISRQDLIDCITLGHTQSGAPCPARYK